MCHLQILLPNVPTISQKATELLNRFTTDMMNSVVTKIQDLGVEIIHIPGGCTGLVQPVDVGVNKPFKCRLKDEWEAWMLREGIFDTKTRPPSREHIVQWSVSALDNLPSEIVKNAWRHGQYSWFLNE